MIKLTDNLVEILSEGKKGNISYLTKEDWEILEILIDFNGERQYHTGYGKGVREGYRLMKDIGENDDYKEN